MAYVGLVKIVRFEKKNTIELVIVKNKRASQYVRFFKKQAFEALGYEASVWLLQCDIDNAKNLLYLLDISKNEHIEIVQKLPDLYGFKLKAIEHIFEMKNIPLY